MRHGKLAAHAVARIVQRWRKGCDSEFAGRNGEYTAANGIMATKKVQQLVGLRASRSEVDIGDKQSAKAPFWTLVTHSLASPCASG